MAPPTGAQIIARSLRDLGVTVIFGIVGIPVVEIAEEAINLGIRFIGFRNEQAAGYAASAYGYLTGRPGICLVVGGPGVLHGMAGVCILFGSFQFDYILPNLTHTPLLLLESLWTHESFLDRECKCQRLSHSPPCRFLRNEPRLPRRFPRTRCHLPPHAPHQACSAPSITRIDSGCHPEYIQDIMVRTAGHRFRGSTCRLDKRCG